MSAPALPSVSFELSGDTYTLTLLDGIAASDLFFEILEAVGGSLSKLSSVDSKQSKDAFGMAIAGAVINGVGAKMLMRLRALFAKSCTVKKDAASPRLSEVFMLHFAGKPALSSLWLTICLKENFADFLDDGLRAKLLELVPALASMTDSSVSTSPET